MSKDYQEVLFEGAKPGGGGRGGAGQRAGTTRRGGSGLDRARNAARRINQRVRTTVRNARAGGGQRAGRTSRR